MIFLRIIKTPKVKKTRTNKPTVHEKKFFKPFEFASLPPLLIKNLCLCVSVFVSVCVSLVENYGILECLLRWDWNGEEGTFKGELMMKKGATLAGALVRLFYLRFCVFSKRDLQRKVFISTHF